MLTEIIKGKRKVRDIAILNCNTFKFSYFIQLLKELGADLCHIVNPIRGKDSWYIQGELHEVPISIFFNEYETITVKVSERVFKSSNTKESIKNFILLFRSIWFES